MLPSLDLYSVSCFPMTTSPWIASISFIHYLLYFLHWVEAYWGIYGHLYKGDDEGLINIFGILSQGGLIVLGYILSSCLTLLSLVSFIYNEGDYEGFRYILSWCGVRIFPALRYLIDINVALCAFFAAVDTGFIFMGLLVLLLNYLISFFCTNYTLRKDYLCCKSIFHLFLRKTIITSGYFLNVLAVRLYPTTVDFFLIFLSLHLLLALTLLISYFFYGILEFRQPTPRFLSLLLMSAILGFSLGMAYDEGLWKYHGHDQELMRVYASGCGGLIFLMLQTHNTQVKLHANSEPDSSIHRDIFFIFNKMEGATED